MPVANVDGAQFIKNTRAIMNSPESAWLVGALGEIYSKTVKRIFISLAIGLSVWTLFSMSYVYDVFSTRIKIQSFRNSPQTDEPTPGKGIKVAQAVVRAASERHTLSREVDAFQELQYPVPPRVNRIDDILSMPKIKFDPRFKNPCWFEANTTPECTQHRDKHPPEECTVLKCLPYFYIIGVCKSGTTDLFNRLTKHPDVLPNNGSLGKETLWWPFTRLGEVKWKNIKDAFNAKRKKIKDSTRSGSAVHGMNTSPFYERLQFLLGHVAEARTVTNITPSVGEEEGCEDVLTGADTEEEDSRSSASLQHPQAGISRLTRFSAGQAKKRALEGSASMPSTSNIQNQERMGDSPQRQQKTFPQTHQSSSTFNTGSTSTAPSHTPQNRQGKKADNKLNNLFEKMQEDLATDSNKIDLIQKNIDSQKNVNTFYIMMGEKMSAFPRQQQIWMQDQIWRLYMGLEQPQAATSHAVHSAQPNNTTFISSQSSQSGSTINIPRRQHTQYSLPTQQYVQTAIPRTHTPSQSPSQIYAYKQPPPPATTSALNVQNSVNSCIQDPYNNTIM